MARQYNIKEEISLALVKEPGHHIRVESGEVKSTEYLFQRLSVAVQQENSVSVLGSTGG